MRISGNSNAMELAVTDNVTRVVNHGSEVTKSVQKASTAPLENSEETKAKVRKAVKMMNEVLDSNYSASKFTYHEGLNRYYVAVVDRDTEEVIREIPPKKLLDAFYEMQKLIGMFVDEKI